MKNAYFLIFVFTFISLDLAAQLTAQFSQTVNTNCLGQPCDYDGPSILINELMISPLANDGSISGPGIGLGRGEWIELYNPNLCEPVDISCYYLGNYTFEGQGGVRLPDNLIVPPGGFVLVRGDNVDPVPPNLLVANGGNVLEVIVPPNVTDEGVCVIGGGQRVWFPNFGGWFAFFDTDGVAQDAVSWGPGNFVDYAGSPCSPTTSSCPSIAVLPSYDSIPVDRKFYASALNASDHLGNSIRRLPDGGVWSSTGAPTYAICNVLPCATVGESTCTGIATITVSGGVAPYSFLWNDSQLQMTQTAVGLCAGVYEVTVTDNSGNTQVFEVTMVDFVPTVTLDVAAEYCLYDTDVPLVNYSPAAQVGDFSELTGTGVTNYVFSPGGAGVGTHVLTYSFTDEFGCSNFAEDEIIVHPIPDVSINVDGEYCTYNPNVLITNVSPSALGGGIGVVTGPGVNGFEFNPALAGQGVHAITYTYTSIYGCVNSATDNITVYQAPNVSFTATPMVGFEPLPVDFTNTSIGATDFSWNFGDGTISIDPAISISHTFQEFGNYTVTLIGSANGCVDTASVLIVVNINPITYEVPNVFSPNGDDANPFFWLINPVGFNRVDEFEILIMNRWGQLVRTYTDYAFGWDGKDESGNEVPEGVYFYKLYMTSEFGEIFNDHGYVHLVRQ